MVPTKMSDNLNYTALRTTPKSQWHVLECLEGFPNTTQGSRQWKLYLGTCSQDRHSSGEGTGKVSSLCSQGVTKKEHSLCIPFTAWNKSCCKHVLKDGRDCSPATCPKPKKLTYLLNSDNQYTIIKQLHQRCSQSTSLWPREGLRTDDVVASPVKIMLDLHCWIAPLTINSEF